MLDFLKKNGYRIDHFVEDMRTQDLIDEAEAEWKVSKEKQQEHSFGELKQSLYRILDDFEFNSIKTSKALPGCLEIVQKISLSGLTAGVVSNTGRGPVISILSECGFLPYLKIVVSRDEVPRMKPSPDGLLEARKLLQAQSDEMLYVGDSVLDIEASRRAGIKCASIASGLHSAGALKNLYPDYMLEKIQDLDAILFGGPN